VGNGTNENTNRLLREYFPQGTEITDDQTYLDLVARALNNRPRPLQKFSQAFWSVQLLPTG
jgi:IS30 family transposase